MTKIVFMGTPDFSVPVLQRIITEGYEVIGVVTQPDRPVGRKRVLTPPPVKIEAIKQGIPVFQPEKIRQEEEVEKILSLNPDLIITAAFGQILPTALLEAPPLGCINVHASLLPDLRGGAPIHYSIIRGNEKTGVTIMYMVEALDAGDMISKVEVNIDERDHVGSLHDKLSMAGSNLLADTLPKLIAKEIVATPQDHSIATFARNIKRNQEKIDWSKTGEEIYNHIRGMNPWPVAFTTLGGSVVKVWWGEKVQSKSEGTPGEVIEIHEDGFVVATGNLISIKIILLQPSGKKQMSAEQYLRGAGSGLTEGVVLGVDYE
ncbi:methionyl-tRNA formyltransferase [Bacillus sp. 2205SS5-2]|uniref:methionyl-tRNA formyltransferase n=1 Tax=Bacillus sp. 2205SS5-2 TaxID=3109031 RepID=UPI003004425C